MIRPVLPIRPFISVSISAAHSTSASCVIGAACLISADCVIGAGAQVKPGDVFRRPPVRPPPLPAMTGQMPVKSIPDPSLVTVGGDVRGEAAAARACARARLPSGDAAAREPPGPRSLTSGRGPTHASRLGRGRVHTQR